MTRTPIPLSSSQAGLRPAAAPFDTFVKPQAVTIVDLGDMSLAGSIKRVSPLA